MAVTASVYNHTTKLFGNGEVDFANLKFMLLDNDATFTASHTAVSSISGDEVSGNGWDAGGEVLASAAVTTVTTNDAKLDADDIEVTATGGAIGPAYKGLLLDATSNKPLIFYDFGEAKTADVSTPFKWIWNATGIYTWTLT